MGVIPTASMSVFQIAAPDQPRETRALATARWKGYNSMKDNLLILNMLGSSSCVDHQNIISNARSLLDLPPASYAGAVQN